MHLWSPMPLPALFQSLSLFASSEAWSGAAVSSPAPKPLGQDSMMAFSTLFLSSLLGHFAPLSGQLLHALMSPPGQWVTESRDQGRNLGRDRMNAQPRGDFLSRGERPVSSCPVITSTRSGHSLCDRTGHPVWPSPSPWSEAGCCFVGGETEARGIRNSPSC